MADKLTGKILRIGIMQGGRIIEDRYLRKPETITVGESPKAAFVLPLGSTPIPKYFPLFTFKRPYFFLTFTGSMTGKVALDGGKTIVDLAELVNAGEAKKEGKAYSFQLGEAMRGTVKIGEVTIIFHFVQAPPLPARPKLPASIRQGWIKSVDWVYFSILFACFVLNAGFLAICSTQPIPKRAALEMVPDRFARFVVADLPELKKDTAADLKTEGEGEKKAVEEEKKDEKKGEKTEKPEQEMSEEEKAQAAARRKAEIAKKVAGMGLVNFLTSKGPSADGGLTALADTLAEGGRFGDIDGTMQGVSGLGVATSATERGRRGGGGGGPQSKEIGRMDVSEGGKADLAGRQEAEIKGSAKLGSLEVDGSLDADSIKSIVGRNLPSIKHCYEQQLRRNPKLAGKVTVEVTVAATGAVTRVEIVGSTLNDRTVEDCIASTIRRWRFSKPEGGEVVFTYPFIFEPIR
ncbi:MAG: energy transducer TonB [Myxococcales bacterium]|nr:MAG: energy transducer TonB [Myxococcales bacterium]